MASIRARLTVWNGGVLVCVLLMFAAAAYVFLRYASLAQVDRALHQQMRVVLLTVRALKDGAADDSADVQAFVQDLNAHGLLVTVPPGMPNAIVTAPARIDEEGERRRRSSNRRATTPDVDWNDFREKTNAPRDDDEAFSVRGNRWGSRVLTERVTIASRPMLLIATQSLGQTKELLDTAQFAAMIALPIVVVFSILSGYVLARRALDPVASMTAEARRIGAQNLHERLSIRDPRDELGQLAVTFNDVLERVDLALEQQRRFTADASHELRTPIAIIRAEADVALTGGTDRTASQVEEYRNALVVIRDGSQQLTRIVNDLFLLARVDAGQTLMAPHAMHLDELVRSTVSGMRSLARQHQLDLDVYAASGVAYVGDEELLRGALRNLLDNAIKYSQEPGRIVVSLEREGATHRIVVIDSGCGISSEDQPHIFERFYRGDRIRGHRESATGAGAGLGLAIAREIVELHGGRVELLRSNEKGSAFVLVLPVSP